MTEDEQIKAAIEMSMKDQNIKSNEPITIDDDDDDYNFIDEDDVEDFESINESDNEQKQENKNKMKEKEKEKEETFEIDPSLSKEELCENFHSKFKAVVNPEPTSGDTTDIQFRLPDGKRMVRSFLVTDKVLVLFEYIKGSIPEAKDQPFDLLNFRESLIDKLSQTLHEANLEDSAISVSYI
ncbi:hypothetical protein BCR32DRAFT_65367 [Anaeromyces robustus]|uniref:UBX domain-containing protein n=1 Tax=Anaeromyces robustus TaxID=1754192 RepID=A0A1Y1WU36_9FUNG|nr:hypothetical protein BCR32DRAFT_65367 [Anaeromyces robustus]|eukprot:ORX77051.1 hypothetical protein BCR32DRAFT_65367 [Anaeromyces robustus]